MRKPNLFIIGAMKCGTTSLHNRLDEHPAIYMSSPKEPTYFAKGDKTAQQEARYLSLFSNAAHEIYAGESSTGYSKIPLFTGVPERIAAFEPHARLIYIMRDPVERVLSHYRHNIREGRNPERLLDAIRNDTQYTRYSDYAMQLEPYFRVFDERQILTLTLEEYAQDTPAVLARVLRWLDLDDDLDVLRVEKRENVSQSFVLDEAKAGGLYRLFKSPAVRRLGQLRALAPLRNRIVARFGRSTEIDKGEIADAIRYLRPIQIPQVDRLREMLDRDFPLWTTLYS